MSDDKSLPVQFQPITLTNDPSVKADHVLSPGRESLKKWLGRPVRVALNNNLILIGIFSCTDRDENLVLSNCGTFLEENQEPISVGNVMVPGDRIVSISVNKSEEELEQETELKENKD